MKKLFAFIILSISLMSCGKFPDGTSVWQGGLWLVAVLPFLGSLYFFYTAYKSSKSGSNINPLMGGGEGGNVPIYKHGRFWFGVGFVVASIIIIIMVNGDK